MLIPSHASSTVVQYSVRDTAVMFEKEGWEVRIMHMKTDLSRWRINKNINDFKPDIYLQVNHLRTEDTHFYPPDMMYITWVQDTVSYINNSENAQTWNEHVNSKKKRRDLIIGYVGQVKEYGYQEDRLSECPMIVNQDIFKERELTPEEKAKYECDICFASNRSKETSLIVKEDLAPKLEKYGFTEDILMSIHDHLWEYYRDEKTCVGYVQLEDKIIELPAVCALIEKLTKKDDHDFVIQRIYWELNDVIYRHIVLEWIDEMGDKKLHLYGRGWEKHPRFSKYARGIVQHGEELALAYQCAKHCLHLNSLECNHQRLTEILEAKGSPITRLSLDDETRVRQIKILEGFDELKSINYPTLNILWNSAQKLFLKNHLTYKSLNSVITKQLNIIKEKLNNYSVSFINKSSFKQGFQETRKSKRSLTENSIFNKLLKLTISSDKPTAKAPVPLPVFIFLRDLFEKKIQQPLPSHAELQSNLLCKLIILESHYNKKNLFDRCINKINTDHLIKEFAPNYLIWMMSFRGNSDYSVNINKTYKINKNACDLNYHWAIQKYKQGENWYNIAIKDLIEGRLSLIASSLIITNSVKWGNEQIAVNDILNNSTKLRHIDEKPEISLIPIFSQILKFYNEEKLYDFTKGLPASISKQVIKRAQISALLENNLEYGKHSPGQSYIDDYIQILEGKKNSNKPLLHCQDLINIVLSGIQRKIPNKNLVEYLASTQNKFKFTQYQIDKVISENRQFSYKQVSKIIEQAYLNQPNLKSLYFKLAQSYSLDTSTLLKNGLKDLLNHNIDLAELETIINIAFSLKKEKAINKIINYSIKKVKLEQAKQTSIISLFSTIICTKGKAKLKSTLSNDLTKLCYSISLLENGLKAPESIGIINFSTPEAIYYMLLLNKEKDAQKYFSKKDHPELLKRFNRNATLKNCTLHTFKIYDFLSKQNVPLSQFEVHNAILFCQRSQLQKTINFIERLYKSNNSITSLYFKLFCNFKDEENSKLHYYLFLKDLKNGKLTIKDAGILCSKSPRLNLEKTVIDDLLNNFKLLNNCIPVSILDLFPIFSQIIKIRGIKQALDFYSYQKKYIRDDILDLTMSLSKLEKKAEAEKNIDKELNGFISLFKKSDEYELDILANIAVNAYSRKREKFAFILLNRLFEKKVLPTKFLILYISLMRDISLTKALSIFSRLDLCSLQTSMEVEYQLTKLLSKKTVCIQKIDLKSYRKKRNLSQYEMFNSMYLAFILCEKNEYQKAEKLIPENVTSNILRFYKAAIYILIGKQSKSIKELKMISADLVSNHSLNLPVIEKTLCDEIGKTRSNPDSMIIKDYLMFRFKSPHSSILEFLR
ncbi:MAG: hypothetical protein NE327_00060 [Lentisphaeraceae bacterium]|nr:hypothetical protein [Lentisphaeraceae bacterium]